jgi:hypothetical protein
LPYQISMKSSMGQSHVIQNVRHYVQFENQLRQPPLFSDMRLSKEQ